MYERPRDGHSLHLSARELMRQPLAKTIQLHPAQSLTRNASCLGLACQQQRQFHILEDRQRVQQLEGLKNEADFFAAKARQFRIRQSGGGNMPSTETFPTVGKSMAPAKFSSVDFPQPLRPTSVTNCPRIHVQRDSVKRAHQLAVTLVILGDIFQ